LKILHPPRTQSKDFYFPPPPLKPRKRKAPDNCNLSFIDEIQDGLYGSAKLVRSTPRTNKDIYFTVQTRTTEVRSNRRNYSHKSVALFRNKKDGPTRANIEYLTCSFLELDGSTDRTIKTKEDVQALIAKNNLPTASYVNKTSPGNFHVLWIYTRPLPWTTKNESYWISQQKRLIELFKRAGFNVDEGASLNPCQNLRNPSQLNPYNFKRRCSVFIYKTYQKTSLRRIYKALNKTSVANPRPMRASTKFRRFLRANETFTGTHAELAETLGFSPRTSKREITKAIQNGDLRIVQRSGNNKRIRRTTEYISNLYIEANSQECHVSISKINSLQTEDLLRDFKRKGTSVGLRQKTMFAIGLFIKYRLGKTASIGAIRAELLRGAMACHVQEKELERTLKNIMKPVYRFPLSLPKMGAWGLLEKREITAVSLH